MAKKCLVIFKEDRDIKTKSNNYTRTKGKTFKDISEIGIQHRIRGAYCLSHFKYFALRSKVEISAYNGLPHGIDINFS